MQQDKARGRPKENGAYRLITSLADLKTQDLGCAKFFGADWKNIRRNWDAYFKDLSQRIEDETEASQVEQLEATEKVAKIAYRVLSAIQRYGVSSSQVIVQYEADVNLCALEPVVENPMPLCFQDLMYVSIMSQAWPAQYYWPKLYDAALLDRVEEKELSSKQVCREW